MRQDQRSKASADGASLRSAELQSSKKDRRPTPDQMYLAEKLNAAHAVQTFDVGHMDTPRPHHISPAALQKWNLIYGVAAVSDAMRTAWGFPPLGGIENPYAYVQGILRGSK